MELMQELSALRAALQELCQMTDRIMEQCSAENVAVEEEEGSDLDLADRYESIYPLCMEPGFFKGKTAVAVIFPDGVRVETPTWKKLAEVILKRCNDDAGKPQCVNGTSKPHPREKPETFRERERRVRSPIKIDRGIYIWKRTMTQKVCCGL